MFNISKPRFLTFSQKSSWRQNRAKLNLHLKSFFQLSKVARALLHFVDGKIVVLSNVQRNSGFKEQNFSKEFLTKLVSQEMIQNYWTRFTHRWFFFKIIIQGFEFSIDQLHQLINKDCFETIKKNINVNPSFWILN